MPRFFLSLMLVILLPVSYVIASTLIPPVKKDQLKQSNTGAYLGISVDFLPNELAAQLPPDVLMGQGIMITAFAPNSPAPKQGLKKYDILLNFNEIPLKHPRQFIQSIKKGKPGSHLKLTLVRQGKLLTLPITMGAENYPLDEDQLDYQFNMQMLGYDGYTIKMPRKNSFEATIRYLAPDGRVRRRSFKGYYNRIMPEIQAAPDLSRYAKQKLMTIIKEKKDDEEGWFGDWLPFSDGVFDF